MRRKSSGSKFDLNSLEPCGVRLAPVIARAIPAQIENPLAKATLEGKFVAKGAIRVDVGKGGGYGYGVPAAVTTSSLDLAKAAGVTGAALGPHLVVELFNKAADWVSNKYPDLNGREKNHDLRRLIAVSIAHVPDGVIASESGGRTGLERLKKY